MLRMPRWAGLIDGVDQYRLAEAPLESYRALLLSTTLDQRHFAGLRSMIEDYLAIGGTIVFNGHIAYPFLPELEPFVPLRDPGLDAYRVVRIAPHPVFEGVDTDDLTFRRGVAGFYGRGHNPPPAGAVVLHALGPQQAPVDWVFARPGGGTVLMHAGNDLWQYLEMDNTAQRIVPQLLHWLLPGGRKGEDGA